MNSQRPLIAAVAFVCSASSGIAHADAVSDLQKQMEVLQQQREVSAAMAEERQQVALGKSGCHVQRPERAELARHIRVFTQDPLEPGVHLRIGTALLQNPTRMAHIPVVPVKLSATSCSRGQLATLTRLGQRSVCVADLENAPSVF